MASYNIKHIEYLRQKANLTYEQAVALLDKYDGDITSALVELERSGALKNSGAQPNTNSTNYNANVNYNGAPQGAAQPESKARTFWDNTVELFIKGLRIKLVIEKGDETIARLPIIYLVVAVFMAPYLAILSVILMFLTGCRVHVEKAHNPDGDRKIRNYARDAENTVRSKMGAAQGEAQPRAPYNAPAGQAKPEDKKSDDDFDSFTVE